MQIPTCSVEGREVLQQLECHPKLVRRVLDSAVYVAVVEARPLAKRGGTARELHLALGAVEVVC
jgi:hypothetical protein